MTKKKFMNLCGFFFCIFSLTFIACGDDNDDVTQNLNVNVPDTTPSPDRYVSTLTNNAWYSVKENKDTFEVYYLKINKDFYFSHTYRKGSSDNFVTQYYEYDYGRIMIQDNKVTYYSTERKSKVNGKEVSSSTDIVTTQAVFSEEDLKNIGVLTFAYPNGERKGETLQRWNHGSIDSYITELTDKYQDKDKVVRASYEGVWYPTSTMVDYSNGQRTVTYVALSKDELVFTADGKMIYKVSSTDNPYLDEDVILENTFTVSNGKILIDTRNGDIFSVKINSMEEYERGYQVDLELLCHRKGSSSYYPTKILGVFYKLK